MSYYVLDVLQYDENNVPYSTNKKIILDSIQDLADIPEYNIISFLRDEELIDDDEGISITKYDSLRELLDNNGIEDLKDLETIEVGTDAFEESTEPSEKQYIYIQCRDRELSEPKIFDDFDSAAAAMRKDFLAAIGEDTVKEMLETEHIDLTDKNTYFTMDSEFGIDVATAWVNDAFGPNHSDWDGKIFEIDKK